MSNITLCRSKRKHFFHFYFYIRYCVLLGSLLQSLSFSCSMHFCLLFTTALQHHIRERVKNSAWNNRRGSLVERRTIIPTNCQSEYYSELRDRLNGGQLPWTYVPRTHRFEQRAGSSSKAVTGTCSCVEHVAHELKSIHRTIVRHGLALKRIIKTAGSLDSWLKFHIFYERVSHTHTYMHAEMYREYTVNVCTHAECSSTRI